MPPSASEHRLAAASSDRTHSPRYGFCFILLTDRLASVQEDRLQTNRLANVQEDRLTMNRITGQGSIRCDRIAERDASLFVARYHASIVCKK